jgi:heptosyltransferase-2
LSPERFPLVPAPCPPSRTVVVHHRSGIGDLIWHIPYLRAIAATSAGGRVSVIARPSCRAPEVLAAEACG